MIDLLGGDQDLFAAWRLARFSTFATPTPDASPVGDWNTVPVRYPESTDEFYAELTARLESASSVRTTYIRLESPYRYTSRPALSYFEECLRWSDNGGALSRVIGVSTDGGEPDEKFLRWLRIHVSEAEERRNYDLRVIPWSPSCDGINMALIDGETAFLTFSGMHAQRLVGLQAENVSFVGGFITYWEQLRHSGAVASRYLRAWPASLPSSPIMTWVTSVGSRQSKG